MNPFSAPQLLGKMFWWFSLFASSALFTLCDTLAKIWMDGGKWGTAALVSLCLLAPFAYMMFGVVTQRSGLAIASGIVNSLMILGATCVGIIFMNEWQRISNAQMAGMALAFCGIILMLFFPKHVA